MSRHKVLTTPISTALFNNINYIPSEQYQKEVNKLDRGSQNRTVY